MARIEPDKPGNGDIIPLPKGEEEKIVDGKGVGIKGVVSWTVSVHFVVTRRYELRLVGNTIFVHKLRQMFCH